MSEISTETTAAMIAHMNDDHAESVAFYAQHFGGRSDVTAAKLLTIEPDGMDIEVTGDAGSGIVRIPFDHVIVDTDDARDTLIAMARAGA
jgi:putative heme iron utilization protein